jgi:hypothetical protein
MREHAGRGADVRPLATCDPSRRASVPAPSRTAQPPVANNGGSHGRIAPYACRDSLAPRPNRVWRASPPVGNATPTDTTTPPALTGGTTTEQAMQMYDDLHPSHFPAHAAAAMQLAHIVAEDDAFDVPQHVMPGRQRRWPGLDAYSPEQQAAALDRLIADLEATRPADASDEAERERIAEAHVTHAMNNGDGFIS